MHIFKAFKDRLANTLLAGLPDGRILVEAASRTQVQKGIELSKALNYENVLQRVQNLKAWKTAVATATDPQMPSWRYLANLYYNMELDNHLASIIDTRILYVKRSAFKMVDKTGAENRDVTLLLERPWMQELIRLSLYSMYQGRTLIEMFDLDDNGELSTITEIPQPYFNSKLGIITKDIDGGADGWNYREAPYNNYYIQIGRDYDLGMFERLAPIVLAKKLGTGSWQDWVDKFGVPPLFITTDREDTKRLEELYTMAQHFKEAGFMVGKGNEKFTVGNIQTSGTNPSETLITYCNDEMSKRILGGTGLVSEKSFVGSAEIQFQLTKDRYESDKQWFKFFFNREVIPRLISLSPIYAPLAGYTFEWDNTESLAIGDLINAINVLGNQFELDPDDVEAKTGIKILGQKMQNFQPTGGSEEKK